MERNKKYTEIKNIFGNNFIGIDEINAIDPKKQFISIDNIEYSNIPYSIDFLKDKCNEYILFYFQPIINNKLKFSINNLKLFFQSRKYSDVSFYNQDWYEKEKFANECNENPGWYLLKTSVIESSRGLMPEFINEKIKYPTANLCIYLFFLNFAVNKTILWQHDYVWCSDLDSNGDNIYVGRYYDINKLSKDGFSIHRHLKLKSNYGSIDFY